MAKEIKVVTFESGQLSIPVNGGKGREAALSLPLSRLLVKVVKVPVGADPVEVATPALKAISPFPDEDLTVGCELVRETESGSVVIAAALPEGSADDIAEALDDAKISVVRIDATVLGQLRMMWNEINVSDSRRRLLKLKSADCTGIIVLDGDMPCAVRTVTDESSMERQQMLALLEAEDFNGPKSLAETIEREIDERAFAGIAERSEDPMSLDAMPESWREVLRESRFKAKLVKNVAVAMGLWLLALAVMFGVPVGYGFMTERTRKLCIEHSRAYRAVKEKKAKTELVRKYSDHSRGALEIMKAVSDSLPDGITLQSWSYARDEGLRLRGESDGQDMVLQFKDALVEMGGEDKLFTSVKLGGFSSAKGGKQRFDIECSSLAEEEE